jgi:diguanylate cyclase (GGDEF)-like protein
MMETRLVTRLVTPEFELETSYSMFLHAYFTCRDMNATKNLLSENTGGFGTGWNEVAFNSSETLSIFLRDFESAPNTIDFAIHDKHVVALSNSSGFVSAQMDISTIIQSQVVKFSQLRQTVIFKKHKDVWLVEFIHISIPKTENDGDESYPVKELEERMTLLARLVDEKTTELSQALVENKRLASTDKLTSIFNRRVLDDTLANEIQRCERYGETFSVLLLDIDHFKHVNDRFGHQVGDRMLIAISNILGQRIRTTDILGRWGGEEFLIICPKTSLIEIGILAETIRKTVESYSFELVKDQTVSIGISSYVSGDNCNDIFFRADSALYDAKRSGRNLVCGL